MMSRSTCMAEGAELGEKHVLEALEESKINPRKRVEERPSTMRVSSSAASSRTCTAQGAEAESFEKQKQECNNVMKMVEKRLACMRASRSSSKKPLVDYDKIWNSITNGEICEGVSEMIKEMDAKSAALQCLSQHRRLLKAELKEAGDLAFRLEHKISGGMEKGKMAKDPITLDQVKNRIAQMEESIDKIDCRIRKERLRLLDSEEFNCVPEFDKLQKAIEKLEKLAIKGDGFEDKLSALKESLVPKTPSGHKIIDWAAIPPETKDRNVRTPAQSPVYRIKLDESNNGNGCSNRSSNKR